MDRFAPYQHAWLERLEAEQRNFATALAWLDESDATSFLRLVSALSWYWWVRGHTLDGRSWLERALARMPPPAMRVRLLAVLGMIVLVGKDDQRAEALLDEGLALARSAADARTIVHLLVQLGAVDYYRGDNERATARLEEALALARSLAEPRLAAAAMGDVLANLGVATRGLGRVEQAVAYHEEALRLHRQAGYEPGEMHSLADLGDAARDLGDLSRAADLYRDCLRLAWTHGHKRVALWALEGLAIVWATLGLAERAARLFGAVERLREATGFADRPSVDRAAYARATIAVRVALGEAAFDRLWASGRAQSLEQAVAAGLAPSESRGEPASGPLTARELDVMRLLAAGRTDREIGDALFIGRRTVESHVARIFEKLGVRTRAAATAAAIASGLVDPPPGPPTA